MANSLIISLAFLKINCDTNKNGFLDNFVPLIAECIRAASDDVINIKQLQKELKDRFGISLPHHVISALLTRAKKREYVFVKNHVYYRNKGKLNALSFKKTQEKVQRIYKALIDDFISFNKEKYGREVSEGDAERIILSFVSYNQVNIYKGLSDIKALPDFPQLLQEEKVIISDFITMAHASRPQIYEYIETIVKGYMIVNAIYFSDVNNINKKFRGTKIIFDTSFIIYALGYSGEEMRSPCYELLDLLYENGAQLLCFQHTIDEIRGILYACSNSLGTYSDSIFGRSVQYFTAHGYTASDITLLISSLERDIESLRIRIVEKPNYDEHEYVIDEQKLNDTFKEAFPKAREEAISRDVDSISSIYRLRRGQLNSRIEECKALFVTTNHTLAKTVNDEFYDDYDHNFVSPCITDYELTNFVWLKTPTKAPNLPMKRVIADCYASIQPDDALMERWISEIEKLSLKDDLSSDDYYFLRYSDEAQKALIEYSLGDPEVITEGAISEILNIAKSKFLMESEQQLEKTRSDLASEQELRKNAESMLTQTSQGYIKSENDRLRRIRIRSNRIANGIIITFKVLSFVLLLMGLAISTPFEVIRFDKFTIAVMGLPRILLIAFWFIALLYNTISQFSGTTLHDVFSKLEVFISNKIYKIFIDIAS